jgi:hypothetical protein
MTNNRLKEFYKELAYSLPIQHLATWHAWQAQLLLQPQLVEVERIVHFCLDCIPGLILLFRMPIAMKTATFANVEKRHLLSLASMLELLTHSGFEISDFSLPLEFDVVVVVSSQFLVVRTPEQPCVNYVLSNSIAFQWKWLNRQICYEYDGLNNDIFHELKFGGKALQWKTKPISAPAYKAAKSSALNMTTQCTVDRLKQHISPYLIQETIIIVAEYHSIAFDEFLFHFLTEVAEDVLNDHGEKIAFLYPNLFYSN